MSVAADFKLLREKNIDKGTTLKVMQNLMSGRIFVEFQNLDLHVTLQKSFQNNYDGKKESEKFSKSIKTTNQLKEYFGLKK